MVTIWSEHTRSRNIEGALKGNPRTIAFHSCIDYYI